MKRTSEQIVAARLSFAISSVLLILKFWAYSRTLSQAVFSDAMESIVNVIGALVSWIVVVHSTRPADEEHPYGHGKIEYFSAAFEGGMIAFAALVICYEAILALINGQALHELNLGVLVVGAAGLANWALGYFLVRQGRRYGSIALVASGQHVMSDFWTSAGVMVGLLLVGWTGQIWIDAVVALVMAGLLGHTGWKIVRESAGGLLDVKDKEILEHLIDIIQQESGDDMIQVHYCRVIRSGNYHHIDAHVVIPEFWNVAQAHNETEEFEKRVIQKYRFDGELHFHVDPCRQAYCRVCSVQACPIRREEFVARHHPSWQEFIHPEEPPEFLIASSTAQQ